MNNTITEMKNILEGINSRITETNEQISDLEERMVEITLKNRIKKKEKSLRDLWSNIKHNHMCIIRVPEGDRERKGQRTCVCVCLLSLSSSFCHPMGWSLPGSSVHGISWARWSELPLPAPWD